MFYIFVELKPPIEQDKNNHNLSVAHVIGLVTMPISCLQSYIFLLQRKFLVKFINHTINLSNFIVKKHSGNRLNVRHIIN